MKDMLSLAFIGDAIHTLFVREFVIKNNNLKMDDANRIASHFCSASSQAKVLDKISPLLDEVEKEIVRKTRNVKNKHKAKNVDIMTYKKATCYEAIVGYYYLNGNKEKLDYFLQCSLEGEK